MTREEYIESVVSKIKDKGAKAEVEAEIAAHLDDRMEFYLNAGYDENYALSHAIERMGDSDKYSEDLSKLHEDRYSLSNAYWMLAFGIFHVVVWVGMTSESWDYYRFALSEMWVAIPVFEGLIAAINYKNKKLPPILLAYYSVYLAAHIAVMRLRIGANMGMAFSSVLVVFVTELFTGDFASAKALVSCVQEYTPSPLQIVLSAIVYIIVYALITGVIVNGAKHSQGLDAFKKSKRQKVFLNSLLTVTIGVFAALSVFEIIGIHIAEHDMVVIVESDAPCDFTQLVDRKEYSDILDDTDSTQISDGKNTAYINFVPVWTDYGARFEYHYVNTAYNEIDAEVSSYKKTANAGLLEYTQLHNVIHYQPSHRYVYAFATESYEMQGDISFDPSYWQSTEKAREFVLPVEQTSCPVNITHIQTSSCLRNVS